MGAYLGVEVLHVVAGQALGHELGEVLVEELLVLLFSRHQRRHQDRQATSDTRLS